MHVSVGILACVTISFLTRVRADIDECATSTHNCDVNADCKNTVGSYECECKAMYFGNGTFCQEKTCQNRNPCGFNTDCSRTSTGFRCNCKSGYEGAISCSDIDECSSSSTNDCDVNADCQNTDGSYTCSCKSLYLGNGTYCERKTCKNSNPCGKHTTCSESPNGFECKCMEGYTGAVSCSDIDECSSAADNNCHSNAICQNTLGSYTCQCKENYAGDGITCEDIDECALSSTNECDVNAECQNTPGSYNCECKTMYFGTGTTCQEKTCENSNPCGANTECQASKIAFKCTCLNGYTGAISCTDIDECATASTNDCDDNAVCINTMGSYNCQCKNGFTGNGTFCEDKDECDVSEANDCDINAECMNTYGSYECECKTMYFGDGKSCQESLPSRANCEGCAPNSHCDQEECVCNVGYKSRVNEGCLGYCEANVVEIAKIEFHFDGNYEGGVSFSNEKCNGNGRSVASVTCTASETGGFSFSMIQFVSCNETVSSVAKQIDWNNSTSEELEKGISQLAITVSSGITLSNADRSVFIENTNLGAASLLTNQTNAISEQTLRQIVVAANSIAESFAKTAEEGFSNTNNITVARQAMTLRHSVEVFSAKSYLEKSTISVVTPNIRAQVQNDLSEEADEFIYSSPTMRMLIPREAMEQAKAKGTPAADRLVFLEYSGRTLFQSSENLTRVITVELGIGSKITDLSKNVLFYPEIPERDLADQPIPGKAQTRRTKVLCSYYATEKLSFSQGGCRLLVNTTKPICACDHMTSFAALIEYEVVDDDIVLSIFTSAGCIVSSVALVIALAMHVTGRNKKEKRQISLSINAHVCASLLMVYLTFVVGISRTHDYGICLAVTIILHYLLLLTWSWTTVYSYVMFNSLARHAPERMANRFFLKSGLLAYGLPLIIVGTTILVIFVTDEVTMSDLHRNTTKDSQKLLQGYMAPNMCWLAGDSLKFGYLLPAGTMLLGNYFVFSYLVYCLTRQRFKMQSVTSRKNATREVVASISMATTLGLTWIFGYMMLISPDKVYRNVMAWIFTITTVLQGLLLFIFTLMRRATLREQIVSSVRTRFSTISSGISVKLRSVSSKVKRNIPSTVMKDDTDSANSVGSSDTNLDQQSSTKTVSGIVSFSTCDSSTALH